MPENYIWVCVFGAICGIVFGAAWLWWLIKMGEEIRKGNRK